MSPTESTRMYRDLEKRLERQGWIERLERARERASELKDFWVEHEGVPNEDIDAFRSLMREASKEEEIQQFFKKRPSLLLESTLGHRGCFCIPNQKLGTSYVADFLIALVDSMGFWWYGVELENPRAQIFNKRGDPTKELTHAMRQIREWRIWLTDNIDVAKRPRAKGGHSLIDITPDLPSFILIGRRKDQKYHNPQLRRQMIKENKIAIHHYDWLLDQVRLPRRRSRSKRSDEIDSEYVIEW